MARFHVITNAVTKETTQVPFTPEEEAAADIVEAAANALRLAREAKAAAVAQAKTDAKADAFVQQFVEMTPAQVIAYVNANINTLADAKQLLTKMALMMLAIAKEQYKD